MKDWIVSLVISFTLIGLSIGVMQGNEHLLNYLLFASMLLLLLCGLFIVVALFIHIRAVDGEKEFIDHAKEFLLNQNDMRAYLFLIAVIVATATALYYGWIMTAVMFAFAEIIAIPAKVLIKLAARCEPSYGDETIDALKRDIEE